MSKYSDRSDGFAKGNSSTKRPAVVTDDHLSYLDNLRESGATNMFGGRPYVMEEFPQLNEKEASEVLVYWMKSFGDPNR